MCIICTLQMQMGRLSRSSGSSGEFVHKMHELQVWNADQPPGGAQGRALDRGGDSGRFGGAPLCRLPGVEPS